MSPRERKKNSSDEMLAFDREHIWHPYSSMTSPLPVYPIVSASGVRLTMPDGRELIDGMSSWWTAVHGYNHPVLAEAMVKQVESMTHVMFGGLTHGPAVELARLLVDITPSPLEKIFYCDSGSVAVEVAMKMALQYWHSLGKGRKSRFLTISSGYHGDTFAAMSVCDPVTGMHSMFSSMLPQQFFADSPRCSFESPWDEDDIESFKRLLEEHHEEIAAVILEPVVQGAGGMKFYNPRYLGRARELCDKHDVLLIFDEIATGFGRTGRLFACEYADAVPDIMCIGKAMTGGSVSFAATLTTEKVSEAISSGIPGIFMHGPTFMGNPLACSAALASIGLLLSPGYDYENKVAAIGSQMKEELACCAGLDHVAAVRVLGAIGVIELKEPVNMKAITEYFVENGVWIRPFGKTVYIMPPYIISSKDLSLLTGVMAEAVKRERG